MRVTLFVGDCGKFTPDELGYEMDEEFQVSDLIDFDEGAGERDIWKISYFSHEEGETLGHLEMYREG